VAIPTHATWTAVSPRKGSFYGACRASRVNDTDQGETPPSQATSFSRVNGTRHPRFVAGSNPTEQPAVKAVHRVPWGDLDVDGDLEIFIANGAGNGPPPNHVWCGDGRGGFQFVQRLGNSNSQCVALGDLDSDGDLDAVVANTLTGGVGRMPNTVLINQTKTPPAD